jgi:hypothetical protein
MEGLTLLHLPGDLWTLSMGQFRFQAPRERTSRTSAILHVMLQSQWGAFIFIHSFRLQNFCLV